MLVEAEDNEKLGIIYIEFYFCRLLFLLMRLKETTNSSLKGRLKSEKREVDLLTEELKTTSRELSSSMLTGIFFTY